MTIPNFKSNEDWEAFTMMFDSRWHCKKALLDRVKNDLFPEYNLGINFNPKHLKLSTTSCNLCCMM